MIGTPEASGLVYANVDIAATQHLMSLTQVIQKGLTLKPYAGKNDPNTGALGAPAQASRADVDDEQILKHVTKMLLSPQATGILLLYILAL